MSKYEEALEAQSKMIVEDAPVVKIPRLNKTNKKISSTTSAPQSTVTEDRKEGSGGE